MQMCSIFAKRLSVTWKHMIEKEKKPYVYEARKLKEAHDSNLKNQIELRKPLEFISWTQIEPIVSYGIPWAKILGPDGLRTLELD